MDKEERNVGLNEHVHDCGQYSVIVISLSSSSPVLFINVEIVLFLPTFMENSFCSMIECGFGMWMFQV